MDTTVGNTDEVKTAERANADVAGSSAPGVARCLHRVSLAQYAGVLAGLAESHELPRVLKHEGIDPTCWTDAEAAWAQTLSDAAPGSELPSTFDEHLAAAQERYGRRLPPLDEDLRAFLNFCRRFASHDDPPAFAQSLGLRLAEVMRLWRRWSARMASDAALAREAQAILRESAGDVVAPSPARVELPPPSTVTSAPGEEVAARAGDTPPFFVPLPGWVADHDGEAALALASADEERREHDHDELAPKGTLPPVQRTRPSYLLTSEFVPPVRQAALPFRLKTEEAAAGASRNAPGVGTVETAAFSVPSLTPVLPFAPRSDSAAADTKPTTALLPAGIVGPASLSPAAGLRGAEGNAPPAAGLTEAVRFEGAALSAVLPFVSAGDHDVELGPSGTTPLPAVTATISAPRPGAPTKISLEAYAAFCAELAAFPRTIGETLQRYGLASLQDAIDLASTWQDRFAEAPAEFETWQRLQGLYLEHCRTKGRPEVMP